VTEVGVRLPAHLTASGRALLALLPPEQVRALFPDRGAFVLRTDTGPTSLPALRALLRATRAAGVAAEDGEVTPGFASLAVAIPDHIGHPVASVAVTFAGVDVPDDERDRIAEEIRRTARQLAARIRA
jgi:DNA-binding IclR family transcriptional regulator